MYSWKTSIHLAAPREKVWQTLTDFAGHNEWNKGAGTATFETEGEVGQGTRIRMSCGSKTTLLTVEEWGPPRLLRLYITRGKTTGSSRFYLTHAPDGGTTLDHTLELDPPLWLEPLMPLAGLRNRRELGALKRWVQK